MYMDLKNNLQTDTGWDIIEHTFDPGQIVTTGSNFMIGNGYLGYRGTFAEWEQAQYVACIVTDTWDTAPDGRWRELCNVPNGLYTRLLVDGEPLSIFEGTTGDYTRALDLRHGVYRRAQTWHGSHGKGGALDVEKFASYGNVHLLAMRYRFTPDQPAAITLITGIDGQVWSLHGEHFRAYRTPEGDGLDALEAVTHEFGIQIDVVAGLTVSGAEPDTVEVLEEDRRVLHKRTFALEAGQTITLARVVAIYTSSDVAEPFEQAVAAVRNGLAQGYDALQAAHCARWDDIWATADIQIDGDLEAQVITRFNLYHNIIATPTHARLPIGARGLSCQVYQGAAFWDQEIFNLPVFMYTWPEVARNVLEYRYDTLDGARGKARRLGYYGAFYAWTSGKTGEELFPDYFFTDVLTGRPIHNHFNSWQIHISPDIVYAIGQYYQATGDWDYIVKFGAEIAFEVAQFLVARVHFKKDKNRCEFIRLLGPDEYHENVDNNAFTMYQARHALQVALDIYRQMQGKDPARLAALMARLGLDEQHVVDWQDIIDLIYLPPPDPDTRLIEQFDGYFALEDITPDQLRERLIDPEEYWGWPNGIAVETQVNKQADVLQLLALHDEFPPDVLRANFDYYEPRTEHGSSLSPSVHALIASKAGYHDRAYEYFMTSATIDLYNASKKVMSGGSFLGGIHTAACGAVWQMIVPGFAGFVLADDRVHFQPTLPAGWDRLRFHLMIRGRRLDVTVTRAALVAEVTDEPLAVQVGAQVETLAPGAVVTFALDQ